MLPALPVGDIVAGNASVSAFSATSASVYTALITPTADGAVTVDVAGSVAQDGVGNSNTAATQLAVTYDGTAPTVAISGASGSINAPFTATFTFSENVTGFTILLPVMPPSVHSVRPVHRFIPR